MSRTALVKSIFEARTVRAKHALRHLRKDDAPPAPDQPLAPSPPIEARTAQKTVDYQGITISVDRPAGTIQRGIDAMGKAWGRVFHVDYGFIKSTQGGDATGIDVYVGRDPGAREAHWISQVKSDGSFDEFKLMLGFATPDSAKSMYLAHTPKRFFGSIATTSIAMVKALLGLQPTEMTKALVGCAKEIVGDLKSPHPTQCPGRPQVLNVCLNCSWVGSDEGVLPAPSHAPVITGKRHEVIPEVVEVSKADELRYVLGVVLKPDEVDSQGDIYNAETIRRAAWDWATHFRNVGLQHKGLVTRQVYAVESYIAPVDMAFGPRLVKAGTWLVGYHIPDDELWGMAKAGKLTGLSIGGFAKKNPVA